MHHSWVVPLALTIFISGGWLTLYIVNPKAGPVDAMNMAGSFFLSVVAVAVIWGLFAVYHFIVFFWHMTFRG
jgi:hypothetical protein